MSKLKRENWNGSYYFVVRDSNQRFLSKIGVKGSKLSKEAAEKQFNEFGTLAKISTKDKKINVYRQKTRLTNVNEVLQTHETTLDDRNKGIKLRRPASGTIQYVVQGFYKNDHVAGRSNKLGGALAPTPRAAKEQAWTLFLNRLSTIDNDASYDEDEGIKRLSNVSDLREGWVSYVSPSKNKTENK